MTHRRIAAAIGLCMSLAFACSAPLAAAPPTDTPIPAPTLTPTATPQPVVIASGTLQVPQTFMADLDAGAVPTDPKSPAYADVDLWFDASSPTERYLEPYNGAFMQLMGATQPAPEQCRQMQGAVSRVDINSLPAGTFLCFVTNIDNVSVVRVDSINTGSPGSITLTFMTWHQP